MSRIPSVAVGPDDDAERAEWIAALTQVIDDNAYCLGAAVEAFEREVQEALDVPHAIGLANGTDALRIGLAALDVGPEHEVVVPAYSFFATASAVLHVGARPRFVDVEESTLNLNPDALPDAFNERTRCVLPAHLYGQAAAMNPIKAICNARGMLILEDAAQVFGVQYEGRSLGGIGQCGTFSFYPTKNLAAAGDAGMLITHDADLARTVRSLRVHGDAGGYQHMVAGWNARMDGFQAAVLSIRLRRLRSMQRARAANAETYLGALESAGLSDRVRPLARTPGSGHGWHLFIVRTAERDALRAYLAERGIAAGIYYPGTLPAQPAFAHLGHKDGEFPVAEAAAREVLALPVHHRVTPDDCTRVVAAIGEFYAR